MNSHAYCHADFNGFSSKIEKRFFNNEKIEIDTLLTTPTSMCYTKKNKEVCGYNITKESTKDDCFSCSAIDTVLNFCLF